MATKPETIYAQELAAVQEILSAAKAALDYSVSRRYLAEALASLDEGRKILEAALERSEDCDNCDGRGVYRGWPHTTCPECQGSSMAAPEPVEAGL